MNIKKLRNQLGLTQVQFADLLGTTQMTISTWENGKCPAYIEKLAELAMLQYEAEKGWQELEGFPVDNQ